MGISYNPKIVTNGLILNLDAGNKKSYSGSGSVWYDLSGNNNNTVLTNGPTFSNTNSGNIVFDGIDDYVNIPYNASKISFPNDNATICVWFKSSTSGDNTGALVTQRTNNNTGFQTVAQPSTTYTTGCTTNCPAPPPPPRPVVVLFFPPAPPPATIKYVPV